jgi:hypothetical protein
MRWFYIAVIYVFAAGRDIGPPFCRPFPAQPSPLQCDDHGGGRHAKTDYRYSYFYNHSEPYCPRKGRSAGGRCCGRAAG